MSLKKTFNYNPPGIKCPNNYTSCFNPITMISDAWAISQVSLTYDNHQLVQVLHPLTEYNLTLDVTVHNLQTVSYPGGHAAFRIKIYLYDAAVWQQGMASIMQYV